MIHHSFLVSGLVKLYCSYFQTLSSHVTSLQQTWASMAHISTRNKERYAHASTKDILPLKKINPATVAHRSNCPQLLAVRTSFQEMDLKTIFQNCKEQNWVIIRIQSTPNVACIHKRSQNSTQLVFFAHINLLSTNHYNNKDMLTSWSLV
jgi:hypothetical protein